jgi:hypothetical protein
LAADKTGPSGADGSSFTITYENVPAAECTKIITAAAGNFYTAGVGTAGNVKAAGGVLNVAKLLQSVIKVETVIIDFHVHINCFSSRVIISPSQ